MFLEDFACSDPWADLSMAVVPIFVMALIAAKEPASAYAALAVRISQAYYTESPCHGFWLLRADLGPRRSTVGC